MGNTAFRPLQVPPDPRLGVVAAFRYLWAVYPAFAEQNWAGLCAWEAAGPPPGEWRAVLFPEGHTGYIWSGGLGQGGRYSSERPAGLRDDQFDTVEAPPGPYFQLRDFAAALVERLPDTPPEGAVKRQHRERIPRLYAAGVGLLEAEELLAFRAGCPAPAAGHGAALRYLAAYAAEARARHVGFLIPGYQAGYAGLLAELWKAGDPPPGAADLLAGTPEATCFSDLAVSAVAAFVGADRLAQVEEALEATEAEAERLEEAARNAASVGEFYGHYYASCPLYYVAMIAYRRLAGVPALPEARQKAFRARANACEEFFVRKLDALRTSFGDLTGGGQTLAFRAAVARIRQEQGEAAAGRLAKERIELMALYPPFWKPYLLGQTDTIPVRAR